MVAALTLGACGTDEDYANKPRPPAPIVIAAAITDRKISVSPTEFGAGPVTLIVSNQTKAARKITLETDELGGTEAGLRQSAGPVAPSGTATLKVDLREGTYKVSVDGGAVKPAALDVGPSRKSSQDDLLLP